MLYQDNIRIDLSKGKEMYVDAYTDAYLGKVCTKRERVFEVFKNDIYYGTMKIECEEIKRCYLGDCLRNAAIARFPGMKHYPASSFCVTNPQSWKAEESQSVSTEREIHNIPLYQK